MMSGEEPADELKVTGIHDNDLKSTSTTTMRVITLFACELCSKNFGRGDRLKEHFLTHHAKNAPFTCACGKAFIQRGRLIYHEENCGVSNSSYWADRFDLVTRMAREEVKQRREAESVETEQCPHCYKEVRDLKLHLRSNCGVRKKYKCGTCHKRFIDVKLFQNHQRSRVLRYCSDCNEVFELASDLEKHKSRVHRKSVCEVCGEEVLTRHLRRHLSVHERHKKFKESLIRGEVKITSERPHLCPDCGFNPNRKSQLNLHRKSCGGRNPVKMQCHRCQSWLLDKNTLRLHLKYCQKKEKPFSCSICPMKFKAGHSLYEHIKDVHINTRKYKCNQCDKGFKRPYDLKRHLRYVHPDPVEKVENGQLCSHCGHRFRTSMLFIRHSCEVDKTDSSERCEEVFDGSETDPPRVETLTSVDQTVLVGASNVTQTISKRTESECGTARINVTESTQDIAESNETVESETTEVNETESTENIAESNETGSAVVTEDESDDAVPLDAGQVRLLLESGRAEMVIARIVKSPNDPCELETDKALSDQTADRDMRTIIAENSIRPTVNSNSINSRMFPSMRVLTQELIRRSTYSSVVSVSQDRR